MVVAANAKKMKTKTFYFGEVSSLTADYNYTVEVTYGKTNAITVTFPAHMEDFLNISCNNGHLVLSVKQRSGKRYKNENVEDIPVKLQMRKINSIQLSGTARLKATGNFYADDLFDCKLSGASRISAPLSISGRSLGYSLSGISYGIIKGKFKSVKGNTSGSSNLKLEIDGNTEDFTASLTGVSRLNATLESVSSSAIKASGSSNATLKGKFKSVKGNTSGSSNLKLEIDGNTEDFTASLTGVSRLNATLESVSSSAIEASGSSNATLSGKTRYISIQTSGAASVNGADMNALNGKGDASGSSNIMIYATDSLDLGVSGGADIKYYGIKDERNVTRRYPKYAATIRSGD